MDRFFFRVEKMQNKTTRRAITTVNGLRTHFDADNRLTIEGFLLKCAHAGGGGGCNYKSIQRSCGRFSTISRSEACILLMSIHGDCVGYVRVCDGPYNMPTSVHCSCCVSLLVGLLDPLMLQRTLTVYWTWMTGNSQRKRCSLWILRVFKHSFHS